MMKTILLLTFVAFTSASLKQRKTILGELIDDLNAALKRLPHEHEGRKIFLRELNPEKEICEHDFFCQAEQELVKKVSGLKKYDDFRTDSKLMCNLNVYNKLNGSTCKPFDEDQAEIPLKTFLKNLLTCVQKEGRIIKKK